MDPSFFSQMTATYSIIAMDKESGEMGGAVQSHFFSVAPAALWAKAGQGVVATQSLINRQFGPDGLNLLSQGLSAEQVLKQLLEKDQGAQFRQAAVLDTLGRTSTHTGSSCIRAAGHCNGQYYSVQANMMLKDTVWHAMEKSFLETTGNLAQRMLAALIAAQNEGGDIRGQQSAGMVVVRTNASGRVEEDIVLDLRVDDHPQPLEELTRLLSLHKGYQLLEAGDTAMEQQQITQAMRLYQQARNILGSNPEALYWHAIAMLNAGETSEGLSALRPLFVKDGNWLELTFRLIESGLASFDLAPLHALKEELSLA